MCVIDFKYFTRKNFSWIRTESLITVWLFFPFIIISMHMCNIIPNIDFNSRTFRSSNDLFHFLGKLYFKNLKMNSSNFGVIKKYIKVYRELKFLRNEALRLFSVDQNMNFDLCQQPHQLWCLFTFYCRVESGTRISGFRVLEAPCHYISLCWTTK